MTHLVFGTGLVGGLMAGGLLQQGFDTRLLGREKHRCALRDGLTLSDLLGNLQKLSPPLFWQAEDNQTFEVIWLTVKCTSVERSIAQLKCIASEDTTIVCCQNGWG